MGPASATLVIKALDNFFPCLFTTISPTSIQVSISTSPTRITKRQLLKYSQNLPTDNMLNVKLAILAMLCLLFNFTQALDNPARAVSIPSTYLASSARSKGEFVARTTFNSTSSNGTAGPLGSNYKASSPFQYNIGWGANHTTEWANLLASPRLGLGLCRQSPHPRKRQLSQGTGPLRSRPWSR